MSETGQNPVVAIAGSAGSIQALWQILASLPADFPASVLYTHHLNGSCPSALRELLQWRTSLEVRWAESGHRLRAGVVEICPPGFSIETTPGGCLKLAPITTRHEALHTADRLFRSAADSFGHRAVAVVLSGGNGDGSDGVSAVHARNGTVLVQHDARAFEGSMPRAALGTGCVDWLLTLEEVAPVLVTLVRDRYLTAALRPGAGRLDERGHMRPSPQLQAASGRLLAMALRALGTDLGNIQLLDRETGALSIVSHRGFGLDFLQHFRTVDRHNGSVCGRAMRAGKTIFVNDVTTDAQFAAHRAVAAAAGFRAVQSSPLMSRDGSLLGVLSTHFRASRCLSPTELHRLERLTTGHTAGLIERLAHDG